MKYIITALIAFVLIQQISSLYESNKQLKRSLSNYEQLLKNERERLQQMEASTREYQQKINNLSRTSNDLRVRIRQTELKCTMPSIDNQSNTAKSTDSGRDLSLGEVLERATNLIQERDAIAEQYNLLRKQCRLK